MNREYEVSFSGINYSGIPSTSYIESNESIGKTTNSPHPTKYKLPCPNNEYIILLVGCFNNSSELHHASQQPQGVDS